MKKTTTEILQKVYQEIAERWADVRPMKPSAQARAYLSRIGSKGGKTTGPTKARTSEQARAAVMVRWGKLKKAKARAV